MNEKHIMAYFFTEDWGTFQRKMVALYDERDLTEKEAIEAAKVDEGNPKIVLMTQAQYETVFRSLLHKEKE